jgi:hypothetical protein
VRAKLLEVCEGIWQRHYMLCFTLLKSQFAPVAARAALAELLSKPEDGMA